MNIDKLIRRNSVLFALLLSGVSFVGLFTKTDKIFSAALCTVAVLLFYILAVFLLEKLFSLGAEKQKSFPPLCFAGFISSVFIYATYSAELVGVQKLISGEFEGGRFSVFFIILSLILALYMGKREITSLSRIYFLLLPILLLPYILTIFDFLGHSPEIKNFIPEKKPGIDIKYFLSPITAFGSVFLLFPLWQNHKDTSEKRKARYYVFSFLLMAVFCILEYIKYLLWFGKDGLYFVQRPDRIMLSQVPFMNVQEIFLVSYYTAYMLKISLFCTCARKYFEKMLLGAKIKKDISERGGYVASFVCSLTAYFVLPKGEGLFLRLCPVAIGVIFLCLLLTGILNIQRNRQDAL